MLWLFGVHGVLLVFVVAVVVCCCILLDVVCRWLAVDSRCLLSAAICRYLFVACCSSFVVDCDGLLLLA